MASSLPSEHISDERAAQNNWKFECRKSNLSCSRRASDELQAPSKFSSPGRNRLCGTGSLPNSRHVHQHQPPLSSNLLRSLSESYRHRQTDHLMGRCGVSKQTRGPRRGNSFESRPMVRPAPDRHLGGKAQPNHRPRTSVSLTYPNGCKAKTKRSLKGG